MVRGFGFPCVPEPQFHSAWQEMQKERGCEVCVPAWTGCILLTLVLRSVKDSLPLVQLFGRDHTTKGSSSVNQSLSHSQCVALRWIQQKEETGGRFHFSWATAMAVQRSRLWDAFLGGSWLTAAGRLAWCEADTHRVPAAVAWLCRLRWGVSLVEQLDLTYLALFVMMKGESRSEGWAGCCCVMGEDCGCCGCYA